MKIKKWKINDFIDNIKKIKNQEFEYYVWNDLPEGPRVTLENAQIGDVVYRASDLYGKKKISSSYEYNVEGTFENLVKIRQSQYDFERLIPPVELCRKWEK